MPAGVDGVSFAPSLRGEDQTPPGPLYWEFPSYGGQQAVRLGDWKAVRTGLAQFAKTAGPEDVIPTQLYHLPEDPAETTDVAAAEPDKLAELTAILTREHTPNPRFPLPAVDRERTRKAE